MSGAKISLGMKAPAYQEYAANMLANGDFRALSLAERGLLYTVRLEFWTNGGVPAEMRRLAKFLRIEEAEITAALPAIASFLREDQGKLICPDLDDYRAAQEERRRRQSDGGKKGAASTNKRWSPGANDGRPLEASLKANPVHDEFVDRYSRAEASCFSPL